MLRGSFSLASEHLSLARNSFTQERLLFLFKLSVEVPIPFSIFICLFVCYIIALNCFPYSRHMDEFQNPIFIINVTILSGINMSHIIWSFYYLLLLFFSIIVVL